MKHAIQTTVVFAALAALFALAANDWRAPWAKSPAAAGPMCREHGVEEAKCAICNPRIARGGTFVEKVRDPQPGECPNTLARVTLAPGVAERINLRTVAVELRPVAETLTANAETMYHPAAFARIAPRAPGIVREVKAVLGKRVEADSILAVIESSELSQARSDLLQAVAARDLRRKRYDWEKSLAEKKIASGRESLQAKTDLDEAEIAVDRALQRLQALGVTNDHAKRGIGDKETSGLMDIATPFAGILVEASAVPGEIVTPERPIFAIADLDRLWLSIDLPERDLSRVEVGRRVSLTVDGAPGRDFTGKVAAIGGEVDDRTRTARVFAEIRNPDGFLRAKMYGQARIAVKDDEPRMIIPREALQSDGDNHRFVFVTPKSGVYLSRAVEVGARIDGGVEVLGGLAAGEKIVTTGSFLLKSEVLRGEMGAG